MMEEISQAIARAVKDVFAVDAQPELTRPDEQFGDYSTNVALQLAGQVGKNPREIAETLKDAISSPLIQTTEVAGPGFLNIMLTDKALWAALSAHPATPYQGQTTVIETNNPNPFKAMHIGHAFNAVLGDTVANLLDAGGAKTYRVSYHGDVGLHVGKSMYSLLKFVEGDPAKLNGIEPEQRNRFMSHMYAEGSKAYEADKTAKAEIDQLASASFTREDPVYAAVYDTCKAWSFEQIDSIVKRLGNQPVERRFLESEADMRGVKIVQDNVPKVFQESNGALVFPGSKYGSFDNVFVASNGQGLYGARDLGLIQLKNEQYHPKKSYVVTAEEQRDYFKGVIAAAALCMPELKDVTVNVPTGTVKLTSGKMSSRSGEVVEIDWLFDQVAQAIKERGGEPTDDIVAGTLRYQFQKVRIGGDVVFDVAEAVSLHGNSGPYLQYAHARARSILSKKSAPSEKPDSFEPGERSLLRKISAYTEAANLAVSELMPHHVANYLYELAQNFNQFYEKNRVLDDPREAVRLQLVQAYADTLKTGLQLLGIQAPDKM